MVHLSVAIGRFFEALLWALARGVGMIAVAIVAGLTLLVLTVVLVRTGWRRRKR